MSNRAGISSSSIWSEFTKRPNDVRTAHCNACHASFKTASTTSMWAHLERKHPEKYVKAKNIVFAWKKANSTQPEVKRKPEILKTTICHLTEDTKNIMGDFKDKRAMVTGASRGIGRAIAVELMKRGAFVYGVGTNEELLRELVNQFPGQFESIICDLTKTEHLQTVANYAQPLDYLVNNAGIAILEPVGKITEETIDKTMAINFKAPLLLSQFIAESMVAKGIKGSIVNVSSQASLKPLHDHTVYCCSKSALDMLTRSLAMEYGPKGIRVNAVNPTVVLTEMGKKNWSDEDKANSMLDKMSIKNFADPSDVVAAVMFLLSSESRMTTGHLFPVDGGFCTK